MLHLSISLPFLSLVSTLVSANVGLQAGQDLHTFITRPDLKPPKWDITYHDKSKIAPGYWFVSPYNFKGNNLHDIKWQPCEVGPTIYDNDGELIWSGACRFPNHIVFDFKVSDFWDGEPALSGCMEHSNTPAHDVGAGWFLGSDYKLKHSVTIEKHLIDFDLHDFNTLENSTRALVSLSGPLLWTGKDVGVEDNLHIKRNGFREINTENGNTVFEWKAHNHLKLSESTFAIGPHAFSNDVSWWDPFHLNSVDKMGGNYLISLRHTDGVYLISGKDGHIMWTAGGKSSDFKLLDGLVWSRQHDARFVSHDEDRTVFTLMDNAYSGGPGKQKPTNKFSRGIVVELNHPNGRPTNAKLLKHYDRPDGTWNIKRGSVQILPNSNVFITWTDGGYLSEFTDDGEVVMEAKWLNHKRFGTYRGYKFDNWVGKPKGKPLAKSIVSGSEDLFLTTTYVSWNGATEVKMYDYYSDEGLLGRTNRTGFETAFVTPGHPKRVQVKALDRHGKVLGVSKWTKSEAPPGWQADAASHPGSSSGANRWTAQWRKVHHYTDKYSKVAKSHPWYTAVIVVNLVFAVGLTARLLSRRRFCLGSRSKPTLGDYVAIPRSDV